MSDFWHAAAGWAVQAGLAGGLVLGLGWAWLRRVDQPARRLRLAGWTVRAAVLAAVLSLFPGWLKVPAPAWAKPAPPEPAAPPALLPLPVTPVAAVALAGGDEVRPGAAEPEGPTAAAEFPAFAAAGRPTGFLRPDPPAARPEVPVFPPPADEAIDQPWDAPPAPEPVPPPAVTAVAAPAPVLELTAPPAPRDRVAEVAPLVLFPYAVVAAAGLLQLAAGQFALARLRRAARPAPPHLQAVFDDLAFGIPFGPKLFVSDRVPSPVCFGLIRPTVLLPRPLVASATKEQLRWVLAHELDHLRRGDAWTGLWVAVARALFFFVPWFWAVRRELALAQEYLADAAAAAAGGQPVDYAAFLVNLSDRPGESRPVRHPLGAAGVRAGKTDLFRRVTMLLNAKPGLERKAPRGWSLVAAGGVLSAAVVLSGVAVAADDDPKPKPKKVVVEKVEKKKPAEDGADEKKKDGGATDKKPQGKKDGEKKVLEYRLADGKAPKADEVAALKKAVEEAARKGDVEAVRAAVEKLEKALSAGRPKVIVRDGEGLVLPARPAVPGVPAVPAVPGAPALPPNVQIVPAQGGKFFSRAGAGEDVKDLEKAIDGLKKAAEQLKDQPEAKAAIEKSIAEYRKKIAEAKQKGEIKPGQAVPAPPAPPGAQGQWHFDWARQREQAVEQMKKGMEKALEGYAKGIEGLKDHPQAQAALKKAMEDYKKAMEQAARQMAEDGAKGFRFENFAPMAGGGFGGQGALTARTGGVRLGIVPAAVPEALSEQLDLPKGKGVLVSQVVKDSAAEKAGIKANDIIVMIGNKDVPAETGAVAKILAEVKAGESIDVVVIRKGKKETIKGVKLPEPAKPLRVEAGRATGDRPGAKAGRADADAAKGEKKGQSRSVTATVHDDGRFTIRSESDGLRYKVEGRLEGGKAVATSIEIRGGEGKGDYTSLEKVPAEHQTTVKQLLGSIGGGSK